MRRESSYSRRSCVPRQLDSPLPRPRIECNLGCLWLFQGRYDQALSYLERSRRRYLTLGATHDSAIAEQELADAYLEMNLAEDAATIYARVVPLFAEHGMRAEQARAVAYHGRACLVLRRHSEARALLQEARALYAAEGNAVGEAMISLTEAQLLCSKAMRQPLAPLPPTRRLTRQRGATGAPSLPVGCALRQPACRDRRRKPKRCWRRCSRGRRATHTPGGSSLPYVTRLAGTRAW
jgi:tetratricopeptide (TPR) repeat protein